MIDEKHLLAGIEELKKSPWFNADYISDERRLGMKEALDMISSILRNSPTIDAIPVEYIEYEKQRLNPVIAVEVKHGDTKEAERLTAIVAVMDAIISNWRYTTGPDWRAARRRNER